MTDTPQLLLAHHLKALKLPTFLREYEKLARLELSRAPLTADAAGKATEDIGKEAGILRRIDSNDPEAARLRANLPQLMQSSSEAAKKQAR